jgi:hypothetical protein
MVLTRSTRLRLENVVDYLCEIVQRIPEVDA